MPADVSLQPLDEGCRVVISGTLDESAELAPMARRTIAPVAIDLAEVRVVDSVGIRDWVDFLRALPRPVTLERCSEAMVYQFGMVRETIQDARVASFLMPYECEACGREARLEIQVTPDVEAGRLPPPPAACDRCGGGLVPAVHADRYLYFLRSE